MVGDNGVQSHLRELLKKSSTRRPPYLPCAAQNEGGRSDAAIAGGGGGRLDTRVDNVWSYDHCVACIRRKFESAESSTCFLVTQTCLVAKTTKIKTAAYQATYNHNIVSITHI